MYFNPKYFSRLFHQVTGSYLSDYIHERRLSRAKEMLGYPQYKVHEVAAAIGCHSASIRRKTFGGRLSVKSRERCRATRTLSH
ncbi:helix-turn-helix domain-containing protein [Paenibacillus sacheonensis]